MAKLPSCTLAALVLIGWPSAARTFKKYLENQSPVTVTASLTAAQASGGPLSADATLAPGAAQTLKVRGVELVGLTVRYQVHQQARQASLPEAALRPTRFFSFTKDYRLAPTRQEGDAGEEYAAGGDPPAGLDCSRSGGRARSGGHSGGHGGR